MHRVSWTKYDVFDKVEDVCQSKMAFCDSAGIELATSMFDQPDD